MSKTTPQHRRRRTRRLLLAATTGIATIAMLAACSAPGASNDSSSTSASEPVSTAVPSGKVTVSILIDTNGVQPMEALGAAFTKKYPNVSFKVAGEDFNTLINNVPRVAAGGNAPDIARATLGNLVKDQLVQPLDGYAKAYGWTSWPQSQFASSRVASDGTSRGTGSLYAVGNGYGLTGVYYNKDILSKLGASAPTTLDQFQALLAKAKAAGYTGLTVNGKDGGLAYPLQNLAIDYSGVDAVSKWVFTQPNASVDTDGMRKAAQTLQSWSKSGYLSPNVLSLDTTTAPTDFAKGKTLFFTSGNWQAPGLQKALPGKVGFMLFPSNSASDPQYAMSASEGLVIPIKAQHKTVAAAFLNFIQTDATARQITVDQFGLAPAGPSDASKPTADGVVQDTLTQFSQSVDKNGLVDFFANATTSMNLTLTAQTQLLAASRTTPTAFAAKLQSDYESQLGK